MELVYRSEMNGGLGSEEGEGEEESAYKQRYERAVRELDITRRRLQQQHQDDLEQLIALKKQLEKKVLAVKITFPKHYTESCLYL